MKTTFTQDYHLPLLWVLLSTLWVMAILRVLSFWKTRVWASCQGLSVFLALLATILWTTYFIITAVMYNTAQHIYDFEDDTSMMDQAEDILQSSRDPSTYTDSECEEFRKLVGPTIGVSF